MSATSVEYLVVATTATAVAISLTSSLARPQRRWALAGVSLLGVGLLYASISQAQLAQLRARSERAREAIAAESIEKLQNRVASAIEDLSRRAEQALDVSQSRERAFDQLSDLSFGTDHGEATVLYAGDSALAWIGRPRVETDSLRESVGVTSSPFYLTLYAVARRADRRAVATRLLYAAPPADRLVRSIGGDLVESEGIRGFRFVPPSDSSQLEDARMVPAEGRALFAVRAEPLTEGELRLHILERARVWVGLTLALAFACFVVAGWRGERGMRWRTALVAVGLACVALAPLSAFSNASRLFDPALYFTPLGGPLTANAAALALTSSLVLLLLLAAVRRQARVPDRRLAVAVVVIAAGLGPFLLRDLARGIQTPPYGVEASLWLIWQIPLFLAAVSVILAGAAAGSAALGSSRGLPPASGPLLAVAAAILAPLVWEAPAGWPWWYTFLWIAAIGSLAVSRRSSAVVASAATVAALGAATLVWGATTRARVRLAEQDVAALGGGDLYARSLAERLGGRFTADMPLTDRALLEAYATSDLAASGHPLWIAAWRNSVAPGETLATANLAIPIDTLRRLVVAANANQSMVTAELPAFPSTQHAVAVPLDSGVITTVVAPRSLLIESDPFARLVGVETPPRAEPPYTLQIAGPADTPFVDTRPSWRREGNELHGDWIAATGSGASRVHAEVEMRALFPVIQRGTLILLLDLAIVGFLWLTSLLADGVAARWIAVRRRRLARSYRTRLSFALFAFFILPAVAFAIWSYQQLSTDAARARQLLVRETLRQVQPGADSIEWLSSESRRLETPLFLYEGGQLRAASDQLLQDLAPTGRLLAEEPARAILVHGEAAAHAIESVNDGELLFGYRPITTIAGSFVLGAPARADELALGRRARDLGILVLVATVVGALAALWLSGIAARQLARPIGTLRHAALSLAGGEREPQLEGQPTSEFLPVFAAFRRMVSDLNASRSALEEATRRTATVLRNVASGVIAVDDKAVVTLANPRADELLGAKLPPGTALASVGDGELARLVDRFLAGSNDEEMFEMPYGDQQWRGRLTRLSRGGAVVTVDDVSEIARAQRVLAWGEMARQVAHEIKNPLTPIRLGVQHLRRARTDPRVDFDRVLEQNVERILKEIDHLDEIARAFSRYGQPPEQRGGAEPTDVAAVLRDLVGLETMGEDEVHWAVSGADEPVIALARREELREVLLNVFENARLARASEVESSLAQSNGSVEISVRDDGHGIPADVLPRIFEPHFSTRTSGSGLGLAISRRLIESWGGTIEISSDERRGTVVVIRLATPGS